MVGAATPMALSSEVARRQEGGTWLWIIDYPTTGE